MTNKEEKDLLKALRAKRKRLAANPKEAIAFLTKVGILTKNGKLSKEYEGLCIPNAPA
jgi:hypothetical protein